jgi:HD-like signal output (HDOD) protein/ActR/RegA family two-component response regulator
MNQNSSENHRVLIVDEDPALTRSFKRALRDEPYLLLLASDGEEALSYVDSVSLDLVITDIRMTGTNGHAFLSEVKRRKPGIVRVVFSGYTERQDMVKLVAEGLAGAYLTKPCSMGMLRDHIRRFLDLARRLQRYREKWGNGSLEIRDIPLQASTYNRLVTMIQKNSSMEDLAGFLGQDPVLAGGILAMANSAFYGSGIGSIKEALLIMGLNTVRNIVITLELFHLFSGTKEDREELSRLKKQAEISGTLFNGLYAEFAGKKPPEEISCCGLLHDIGAIVMLSKMPGEYHAARKRMDSEGIRDICKGEKVECGLDHQELGALVLDLFNMPYPLIECAMHHHDPVSAPESEHFVCGLVHIAAAFARKKIFGPGPAADVDMRVFDLISEEKEYVEHVVKKIVPG